MPSEYVSPIKSVGHGTTCIRDLNNNYEVWKVLYELAQDVSHRLRMHGLKAHGVRLFIRDNELSGRICQAQLKYPTQSPLELAQLAYDLFRCRYYWEKPVRALTISAINVGINEIPEQIDMFGDYLKRHKRAAVDDAVDQIRQRLNCAKSLMPIRNG